MPSCSQSPRPRAVDPAGLRVRLALMALATWLVAAPLRAQALPPEIDAALARAKLPRDAVTLVVADADARQPPRLAHRPEAPVNPASIAKLATTFAALELLGPGWTWNTPVFLGGPLREGTLLGNLYIQGQGDPRLTTERLWQLLRRVQGLGIRRITGDIVLDRSAFELPPHDPAAFDGEALRPYNAGPDALLVNYRALMLHFTPLPSGVAAVQVEPPLAGLIAPETVPLSSGECADWRGALRADFRDPARLRFDGSYPAACGPRSWPVAAPDANGQAVRAVGALWRDLGGQVDGAVREGRTPAGLKPVFMAESPTLAEVVRDINKFSNNVMAQQLFLTLSLQQRGVGTIAGSRAVLQQWWRERLQGEPPVFDNGSGLSREERANAAQLTRLLQHAWRSPLMPEFIASLPLAGVDGTARRAGGRAAGTAHLKTGSLRDVAGVAGYVHAPGGRRWVLVAIANHPNASAAAMRPVVEALVEWAAKQP